MRQKHTRVYRNRGQNPHPQGDGSQINIVYKRDKVLKTSAGSFCLRYQKNALLARLRERMAITRQNNASTTVNQQPDIPHRK